jgi:hypothetical protein
VNKKNQKNFDQLDRVGFTADRPVQRKFLRAFFKKRCLLAERELKNG